MPKRAIPAPMGVRTDMGKGMLAFYYLLAATFGVLTVVEWFASAVDTGFTRPAMLYHAYPFACITGLLEAYILTGQEGRLISIFFVGFPGIITTSAFIAYFIQLDVWRNAGAVAAIGGNPDGLTYTFTGLSSQTDTAGTMQLIQGFMGLGVIFIGGVVMLWKLRKARKAEKVGEHADMAMSIQTGFFKDRIFLARSVAGLLALVLVFATSIMGFIFKVQSYPILTTFRAPDALLILGIMLAWLAPPTEPHNHVTKYALNRLFYAVDYGRFDSTRETRLEMMGKWPDNYALVRIIVLGLGLLASTTSFILFIVNLGSNGLNFCTSNPKLLSIAAGDDAFFPERQPGLNITLSPAEGTNYTVVADQIRVGFCFHGITEILFICCGVIMLIMQSIALNLRDRTRHAINSYATVSLGTYEDEREPIEILRPLYGGGKGKDKTKSISWLMHPLGRVYKFLHILESRDVEKVALVGSHTPEEMKTVFFEVLDDRWIYTQQGKEYQSNMSNA